MKGMLRGLATQVLTVMITLSGVALWMRLPQRGSATIDLPEPSAVEVVPVASPAQRGGGEGLAPASPPFPVDADEQANIRVYAASNKSVVNITTAAEVRGFFGDEVTTSGSGSGFVIDRDGTILTNFHVVENADEVQVTLSDGSTHQARVVGLDASNDVALLDVDAPRSLLFPLPLGDSSRLVVGQKILAIGNPFGLERTLTTGIVSSLDRSLKAKNGRMIKGIVQTDAAINPGNSGGPLLNSRGEVIGMNTAIVSPVGQSAGISFAVPINTITRILDSLRRHGRVIRADLGITRVYRTNGGLLVLGLTEGGPADRAGVRGIGFSTVRYGNRVMRRLDPATADLLISLEGKPVRSVDELLEAVESHAPGETVTLRLLRDGEELDVEVVLGES
jgi:S1-C subfamily serine protease